MFYRASPWFAVEAIQKFGLNFVRFQMATGERRWYIIGFYLAHENVSTIESGAPPGIGTAGGRIIQCGFGAT